MLKRLYALMTFSAGKDDLFLLREKVCPFKHTIYSARDLWLKFEREIIYPSSSFNEHFERNFSFSRSPWWQLAVNKMQTNLKWEEAWHDVKMTLHYALLQESMDKEIRRDNLFLFILPLIHPHFLYSCVCLVMMNRELGLLIIINTSCQSGCQAQSSRHWMSQPYI